MLTPANSGRPNEEEAGAMFDATIKRLLCERYDVLPGILVEMLAQMPFAANDGMQDAVEAAVDVAAPVEGDPAPAAENLQDSQARVQDLTVMVQELLAAQTRLSRIVMLGAAVTAVHLVVSAVVVMVRGSRSSK